MIGLFIVVAGSIGAAVDRNSTRPLPVTAGGALCHTKTAALDSAPSAASRRSLVSITPLTRPDCRECTSRVGARTEETRTCSSSRYDAAEGAAGGPLGWGVVAAREQTNGGQPTLWAVSDLHTGHIGNKPVTESLHPSSPDDWLIVAGDVAERTDEIRWSLDVLRRRFAKVIWVPGNHELWTTNRDPVQVFGRERYDYLVNMCDEMGIVTPEHPYPVWTERGGPATIVPMFLLYDYTFLPEGAASKAEGLAIARERNVVATDEFLLSPEPYPTREAWCRDRLATTRARLEQLDWMTPTVLVNHFPLVREPCDALFYPEFSLWCGTTETADWHTRYNAVCSVYGHLHIPRTTWYDGVRFEEVSVGYPREWRRRKPYAWLRQVLPDPQYAPGYLNEFGGHFVITPEMRAQAERFRERLRQRR